jgi:hypothetical protein
MGSGLAPAPGLAVLLSASGRGNSQTASSQQPGNGALVEGQGCSELGCFRHLHHAEAHSNPGACEASINN